MKLKQSYQAKLQAQYILLDPKAWQELRPEDDLYAQSFSEPRVTYVDMDRHPGTAAEIIRMLGEQAASTNHRNIMCIFTDRERLAETRRLLRGIIERN